MIADTLHRASDPTSEWAIWGQPSAIAELQGAVRSGPGHAYVFTGPPQTGKRLAALEFARALCCPSPPEPGRYCGACSSCRRIARGVFPDVTLFNLETQAARDKDKSRNLTLNIATVREVSSAVSYRPTEAKWRIAIVDDVETMQETAQEAFLKTLEEPPPYAVVVLVTSDADVLLPTIRSRCVTVRFGLSPVGQIHAALLASGAGAELADRAATAAQGAMGWAFQAIDDQSLIEQRESTSKEAMELVLASSYERMVKAVLVADSFGKQRDDVFALLRAVQGVWRSALYLQQGFESDSTALLRGDAGERLGAVSLTDLMRALRSVDVCIANLEANVRPRLAMESMVLAWPKVRER